MAFCPESAGGCPAKPCISSINPHLNSMNRRGFTRGLASLGLTPALPLPAFGAGSASTAAAAASAEHMYFMGWYTARLNKTCSPETLIRELKLKPDVAHEIFA